MDANLAAEIETAETAYVALADRIDADPYVNREDEAVHARQAETLRSLYDLAGTPDAERIAL